MPGDTKLAGLGDWIVVPSIADRVPPLRVFSPGNVALLTGIGLFVFTLPSGQRSRVDGVAEPVT